jgi:hypothetical protein
MSAAHFFQRLALPDGGDAATRYPVELWDPPHCGHSALAIDRDGTWSHDGRPIARPEMVRLFARLLRREGDGGHVLVTPTEKLKIDVADAPLMAVELASEGAGRNRRLSLRIGATGDWIAIDAVHRLVVEPGPRPYVLLDAGLRARLARPVFLALAEMALAEMALAQGDDPPGLWSHGAFQGLGEPA